MDIMVRMLLKYSWIKFMDTVYSVCFMYTNIQPNIKVFSLEGSSP
jgi:hypothetical protein